MISANTHIGSTVSMIILNSNSTSQNEDMCSLVTSLRKHSDITFGLHSKASSVTDDRKNERAWRTGVLTGYELTTAVHLLVSQL